MKKTFTTTLMTLLLCVCMVFGLTACGGFTQDDIDNAVNDATATLNSQIAELEGTIADKNATIADLEADVATLTSAKADLEAQITALNGTIDDKNAEIKDLNTSISDLNTEKETLTARVTELNNTITAKETQIAELNSSIDTLKDEKQDLTDRVAELEGENEILKNCFVGKHVMDTDGEISYAWSKDYSTCTATGVCIYCDGEATEVANGVAGDNKITATFENSSLEAQVVHTVTTRDELNTLLQSGEAVNIRLDATLENIQSLKCHFGTTAVLDMNGNDITFEPGYFLLLDAASLTLKGEGTITASGAIAINCRGTLSIEDNVTVNGTNHAISFEGYPYSNATLNVSGGTINAQGNGKNFGFNNEYVSLTITGGTFSCDPTEYVDTEKYAVTENDGTYTVGCNHKNSAHTTCYDIGNGAHAFTCTVCARIAKESHSLITTDKGNGTHAIGCTICDSKITEKHSYDDNDECACGAKIPVVTTYEELLKAVKNGGNIKLGDDIELTSRLMIESDVVIDLNGNTLSYSTGNVMYVYAGATVSISNGNIVGYGAALENYGTLSIDNCTLTAGKTSLDNSAGTTVITNSTLNGRVDAYGGTVTLHSSVTLGAGTSYSGYIGLNSNGGSIVSYFDPSDMLYGESVVTNNGDGTWTVTKAE